MGFGFVIFGSEGGARVEGIVIGGRGMKALVFEFGELNGGFQWVG